MSSVRLSVAGASRMTRAQARSRSTLADVSTPRIERNLGTCERRLRLVFAHVAGVRSTNRAHVARDVPRMREAFRRRDARRRNCRSHEEEILMHRLIAAAVCLAWSSLSAFAQSGTEWGISNDTDKMTDRKTLIATASTQV